jgi:hypothetical protein
VPLIDDRGRLFGKLNLIDAIVGIFVLLLIPLAYGSYLLFRAPTPTIESMQPVTILEDMPTIVAMTGEHLRPFLRARVGALEAKFYVQAPTVAELQLPALPPGTYDLTLYDESTQVLFRPRAFTVQPTAVSSTVYFEAVGTFVGLAKDAATLIGVGAKMRPPVAGGGDTTAEVLAVQPPEPTMRRVRIGPATLMVAPLPSPSIPAIVRVPCTVGDGVCTFAGTTVSRGATLVLSPPSAGRSAPPDPSQVQFVIDQLFPPGTHAAFPSVVTARVRFIGGPELSSVMKTGDADVSAATATDPEHSAILDANRAVLTAVASQSQPMTAQITTEPQVSANPLRRTLQLQQAVVAFDCTVRIPVVFTPLGWSYRERPVKVGAPFVFESIAGVATGWILDVKVAPDRSNSPQ